jgi:hypothetical protein
MNYARFMSILAATAFTLSLPVDTAFAAKAAKKDRRSQMTAEQKKDLRKRAREWCIKNYAKGNAAVIDRIDILSDGSVRCWYRG